ncbi:E3 ubiquitin protein ligase like [Verticillium longisporum]|nr:E3 ubiquitin protein ligase like [Verticillium longisporum]
MRFIPVIKYLWQTMSQTSLFERICHDKGSAHAVGSIPSLEWRLTLLFLELYTFILRLSDDDDFFSGIWPRIIENDEPQTRLRACSLTLEDVKNLTLFLKNLAFGLHYYTNEILQDLAPSLASSNGLDLFFGLAEGQKASNKGRRTSLGQKGLSFDKPDLAGLRAIVTSTLRMLYERDSRRPFLPRDHWLMTSKFDMEKFASSVVREHDRQQEELANLSDDEDQDEEDDMDDDVEMENGVHTFAGQRLSQHAQIENIRARQRRAQKARMLSVIGPKLEILRHMPFVIPFDARVHIFRQFIYLDQQKRRQGMDAEQWRMSMINNPLLPQRGLTGRHRGSIKRGQEFDDAFEQFFELGESLKEPVQIQFIDSFGDVEAGIDGGGVAKEFLLSAINQVFMNQSEDRYFVENSQKLWYPNPIIFDKSREEAEEMGFPEARKKEILTELSQKYEFLGRLSRNLNFNNVLSVVEQQNFSLPDTTDPADPTATTNVTTTVVYKSRLGERLRARRDQSASSAAATAAAEPKEGKWLSGWVSGLGARGIQRSIENIASSKTEAQIGKSREGMRVVLERLRHTGVGGVLEMMRRERQLA